MDELKNLNSANKPKNSKSSILENLKNKEIPQTDRAKQIVEALGLEGDERSVVVGLKRGDRFQIIAMNKMELPLREGQTTKFVPIIFGTSTGASIGAKHFVGVEIDDDAPAVGSTPVENANFLVWCIDHNVTFVVKSVVVDHIEATENSQARDKKTYKLEVADFE